MPCSVVEIEVYEYLGEIWQYFPPKRRISITLHGVISHKMVIFIVTAMRISYLTFISS
jgi:hypothetical protein